MFLFEFQYIPGQHKRIMSIKPNDKPKLRVDKKPS